MYFEKLPHWPPSDSYIFLLWKYVSKMHWTCIYKWIVHFSYNTLMILYLMDRQWNAYTHAHTNVFVNNAFHAVIWLIVHYNAISQTTFVVFKWCMHFWSCVNMKRAAWRFFRNFSFCNHRKKLQHMSLERHEYIMTELSCPAEICFKIWTLKSICMHIHGSSFVLGEDPD